MLISVYIIIQNSKKINFLLIIEASALLFLVVSYIDLCTSMNIKKNFFLSAILTLVLGGVIGFFIGKSNVFVNFTQEDDAYEVTESGYDLISPLLQCEVANSLDTTKIQPIKQAMQDLSEQYLSQTQDGMVSIYFRDLNNGGWIGIGEREKFVPASLFKVNIFMAYLMLSEEDPSILQKEVIFSEELSKLYSDIPQFFSLTKPEPLVIDQTYTIKDLLERMIEYSDNLAMNIVIDHLDPSAYDKLNQKLGIEYEVRNSDGYVSPRAYSSLFRVLYNASFLNKKNSEYALERLTRTAFTQGLRAGVPSDVVVASKYGERSGVNGSTSRYLHDCGIIYHSQNPYVLCIMTKGEDFVKQARLIKDISSAVYTQVGTSNK